MTTPNIRKAAAPNLVGRVRNPLFKNADFEAAIWDKGYNVIIEKSIECPCKGNSSEALSTCNNCLGTGFVFINPVNTKAILTSINRQTKYQQWSPEFTGTISITTREEERLSFMDKVTLKDRTSILSEVRPMRANGAQKFIFTSYAIVEIEGVYLFESGSTKLVKLSTTEYAINSSNNMVVDLNVSSYPASFNGAISIRYKHNISYNVIDLRHDIRSTFVLDNNGKQQEKLLPINAIARKSHYVIGNPTNYGADNLLNNSDY